MVHDADFAAVAQQAPNLETQCRLRTLRGRVSSLLLDAMDKFTQHSLVAVAAQRYPIIVAVGPTELLILTNPGR